MAHFAKLGVGNKVLAVEVVSNDIATTEQAGVDFLNTLYKTNDIWKQTSYNTVGGVHLLGGSPFRKNYAGIGYKYNEERNAFIPPRPFNSWTLNEETCHWEPPVAHPTDGERYKWNEDNQSWDLRD
tara:strand:+ start:1415 stop:1792 length:378 start_codon:yes stop_codon:yes gene_type:complete